MRWYFDVPDSRKFLHRFASSFSLGQSISITLFDFPPNSGASEHSHNSASHNTILFTAYSFRRKLIITHAHFFAKKKAGIKHKKVSQSEWNRARCFKAAFLVVLINMQRVCIALIPHARIQSHLSVIYSADEFYNIITCNIQFSVMRYAHVRRISRIIIFCIITYFVLLIQSLFHS